MTYRERREAKAARLAEWAAKRDAKADAGFAQADKYAGDTAFWTQPGRIIERERIHKAGERAMKDRQKADEMGSRAAGITSQLDRSIYSDDVDAAERLVERIAALEAERDRKKAINAEIKKGPRWSERIDPPLTDAEKDELKTWAGMHGPGFRGFGDVSNVTANIKRNRDRLADLSKPRQPRSITARRDGECSMCEKPIRAGVVTITEIEPGVWVHASHAA